MRFNGNKIIFSVSVVIFLNTNLTSWAVVFPEHGSFAKLDDIIPVYEVVYPNDTMVYASMVLSRSVSVGFEEKLYRPNEQPKRFSLKLTSSTLRGVLDALVEKDPDYFWEMDNAVVNIVPKASPGKGKYSESVLNAKLPKVNISGQEGPLTLLATTKLVKIIRESGVDIKISTTANPPDMEDYFMRVPSPRYSISIFLENPTIRQALNAIVRADTPSSWEVTYYEDGIGIQSDMHHGHRGGGRVIPAKKDQYLRKQPKRMKWGKPVVPPQSTEKSKP